MQSRILIVDDEPNILNSLTRSLHCMSKNWSVHYSLSVDEAKEMLKSAKFDLVISDISMPGKDGFDLLAHIRREEATKDIPVLMLSGLSDRGLKGKALDMGASDLLHKPFDREELIARINSMLRLKEYQDKISAQKVLLEQEVKERTKELERTRLELIWRLGKAAEYRDTDTGNHVVRVGYSSRALAQCLGMSEDFAEKIFLTSPMHDIGKIGIPDHILLKRGKLTDEEWEIMKQHCKIGANILEEDITKFQLSQDVGKALSSECFKKTSNPLIRMAAGIALSHHERWDGSGYPNKLAKEEIPLESRIVSIVDVYDSLCSARPYKPSYPEEKVLMIMEDEKGSHFDPEIFNFFSKSIDIFKGIQNKYSDNSQQSVMTSSSTSEMNFDIEPNDSVLSLCGF
ncbi:putative two component response regulator [uncultured Desulfobacterium sp.]|uniref:Putative two component response regulator n=1 Tax=uncultured Desulfobacterium sp. TaxID=201089 RepID=A0A445MXR5_9BACT|nr:putative two component response regulator [uncultured Desulfobacterium sp.]